MTPQEAIQRIKNHNEIHSKAEKFAIHITEALNMAVEALKKQIPKKPTYEDIGNIYGALKRTCGNCGDVCMVSKDAKPHEHYCRYCGQAFEGSVDNGKENQQ